MAPPEPATWDASLERIERELGQLDPSVEVTYPTRLQLVIACQLRELLLALRPLTNHPLLRRN